MPTMNSQLFSSTNTTATSCLQSALVDFEATLDETQRGEFQKLSAQPHARAVVQFTAELDRKNAERRSRCIAARLHPVLETVQQYSRVVDMFVSSNPKVAALLWGSIKLTLHIASNFASYFEKLTRLFMSFSRHCPRYSEYQHLFPDTPRLQESLCNFHVVLVRCCIQTVQAIQRTGWMSLLKSAVSSFEQDFAGYERQLHQCQKEIKEEIRLACIQRAYTEAIAQLGERKAAKWNRSKIEHFIDDTTNRNAQLSTEQAVARRERLLDQLSDLDYSKPLRRARYRCVNDTALWLPRSVQFQAWINDKCSSLLTCFGKLGCGKTFLIANTIVHLFQILCPTDSMSYHFCQFDDETSLSATKILSSLIRQLLDPVQMSAKTEEAVRSALRNQSPEPEDLRLLFQEAVSQHSTHYVIIDAIDECSDLERKAMLAVLKSVITDSGSNIKLCLSRRDREIKHQKDLCSTCYAVNTNSPEAQADLEVFITRTLEMKIKEKDLVVGDDTLISEIRDALITRANGMFLWADLQISDICTQESDSEIKAALRRLPRGLSETYTRQLQRIERSGRQRLISKVFQWTACAKRQLTLEEVGEAIVIEPYQTSFRSDQRINDLAQLPSWCHGLLLCHEEDDTVQFIHSTVRDFLLRPESAVEATALRIDQRATNYELGRLCVTYLNFNDFKTQVSKRMNGPITFSPERIAQTALQDRNRSFALKQVSKAFSVIARTGKASKEIDTRVLLPKGFSHWNNAAATHHYALLDYASHFWVHHGSDFSGNEHRIWSAWKTLMFSKNGLGHRPWTDSDFHDKSHNVLDFLERENHLGLLRLIELSDSPLKIDQLQRILNRSAQDGKLEFVDDVLAICQTPRIHILAYAVEKRRSKLVAILLHPKANINMANSSDSQALAKNKLKWLSDDRGRGAKALTLAAEQGYVEIVQSLAEAWSRYASTELRLSIGPPALIAATMNRHGSVVDYLLKLGVDFGPPPRKGPKCKREMSAFGMAIQNEDTEIVEIFVSAGVNVNVSVHGDGGSLPLLTAAEKNCITVMEILLKCGALVNGISARTEPSYSRYTAIQAAAACGHAEAVSLLIRAGANVHTSQALNVGHTPLELAADQGHLEVLEILLASGAEVNAKPRHGSGRTALYTAIQKDQVQIVKTLLSWGANVNVEQDLHSGEAALQTAARVGNATIVKLLLEAGAIMTLDPLSVAIEHGHTEVVELLKDWR